MADDLARKIDPRYSHGELVRVARAQHQAEAEFVQSLLIEEGIPSMVRRSAGFDVPDMLAAGPRDVLVPRWDPSVLCKYRPCFDDSRDRDHPGRVHGFVHDC